MVTTIRAYKTLDGRIFESGNEATLHDQILSKGFKKNVLKSLVEDQRKLKRKLPTLGWKRSRVCLDEMSDIQRDINDSRIRINYLARSIKEMS